MVNTEHIHIYTSRFVENLAFSLYTQLRKHFSCTLYTRQITYQDIKQRKPDVFFFFISPQSTISKSSLEHLVPKTYFIYQTEQLNNKERAEKFHNNDAMNKVLKNACSVFDYSKSNIMYYKYFYENPPLYLPFLPCKMNINSNIEKSIDILFYGSLNQRRYIIIEVLKKLLPNLHIEINENLFGSELTKKIQQSKIILNIHNYESPTLETARLMEAISCNTHIISEKTSECELLKEYSTVHFIDEIIDYQVKDTIDIQKSQFNEVIEIINKCLDVKNIKHICPTNNIANAIKLIKKLRFINTCFKIEPTLAMRNHLYNYIPSCNNSTLFIEFRVLPYCFSIILNMMMNFPHWNHTIVCNHTNKELFQEFVSKYNSNMQLIIIDREIYNVNDYNNLLLTESFWSQFTYDHILLYQEDSFVLHNKIDKFLLYDYVGAPWPHEQNINNMHVGNGGFSLRKVNTLIKCFHKITPELYKKNVNENVKKYMKEVSLNNVPEDVYFSSIIHDENIGVVSPYKVAQEFALESSAWPLNKPMGIHQYWNFHDKHYPLLKNIKLHTDYYKIAAHRGGWNKIINYSLQNKLFNTQSSNNDIFFIDSLEKYFIWENNEVIKHNWIGVIHYTNNYIPYYKNDQHVDLILENKNFLDSISSCVGIICLSSKSMSYVKKYLKNKNIMTNVYAIKHPIMIENIKYIPFEIENIIKHGIIIQLGLQYRITSFIYRLKTSRKKLWLPGCNVNKAYDSLATECAHFKYSINIKDVQLGRVSDEKYDELLINNIIVIPLFSASANNSILEIIILNVPAFVIYDEAATEYIGHEYPLFIENIEQLEAIINDKEMLKNKLMAGYNYLKNMNKDHFHVKQFYKEIYNIAHQV